MDFEDLLAIFGIVIGLALLATVVLTTLDLWDLHRQGAPPEAYARRICTPIGFLARQPAHLLRYLGLGNEGLNQDLNVLAERVTAFCEETTLKFLAPHLRPQNPKEPGLRREAI